MMEVEPKVLRQIQHSLPETRSGYWFTESVRNCVAAIPVQPSRLTEVQLRGIGAQLAQALVQNHEKSGFCLANTDQHVAHTENEQRYLATVDEVAGSTREALHQCVDELTIEPAAKQFIQAHLDHAVIDLTHPWLKHCMVLDDEGRINVLLIADSFTYARFLFKRLYHERDSGNVFVADITRPTAHELGHGIDLVLMHHAGWDVAPSLRFGDFAMDDFPIRWETEKRWEPEVTRRFYNWTKEERFADYFSTAVLRGLGFRETIITDTIRTHLQIPYETKLKLGQLRKILEGFKNELFAHDKKLSKEERQWRDLDFYTLFMDVYENAGLALMYPFSSDVVETIINTAWNEKPHEAKT